MSTTLNGTDDPLKIFVSRRILDMCQKNDKSRYWLARNAGISNSNISSYVNCETLPTLPLVKRICDAFGITLSQFFSQDRAIAEQADRNPAAAELTDQALAVARLWSELNLKDRESALRHMQGLRYMEETEGTSMTDSENP